MRLTVSDVKLDVRGVSKAGKEYTQHILVGVTDENVTKEVKVFSNSEVAKVIAKHLVGKDVDVTYKKEGNFFKVVDISPAKDKPAKTVFKSAPSKAPVNVDWAAKDLSMELGGLMHDVALLLSKRLEFTNRTIDKDTVADLLLTLYEAKKDVTDKLNGGGGTTDEVVKTTKKVESKPSQVYEVENEDDSF